MLSLIGLSAILAIVFLLLNGRVGPIVVLTLVPLIAALVAGFSFVEIGEYFNQGLLKVMNIAAMFMFAILFFGIMQDAGLFDVLINKLLVVIKGNVIVAGIVTIIVAAVAHIDGSGASTFLITIPALLPLYRQLNMSPYLMILLIGLSASILNMLPWAGPLGRVATVLEVNPVTLWIPLIPVQIMAFFLLLAFTFYLAKKEKTLTLQRQSGVNKVEKASLPEEATGSEKAGWRYYANVLLTLCTVGFLVSSLLPPVLVFMIAVSLALLVNYPNQVEQFEQLKKHAPGAVVMSTIIFSAGVFLGILKGTGMLTAVAQSLVTIIPPVFVPYLHLIIGFFGIPLELVLNTDAYYFALFPVIDEIVSAHGVSSLSAAYAMIIGNILGTFISPFSPALWLALGLARLEMGQYIRYAFFWVWGFALAVYFLAYIVGVF